MQVGLGGDAAGVQAGAADLFLLNQTDGEAQLACANSCRVASGTAAEDEDIEFLSHDIAPLHSWWGTTPCNEFLPIGRFPGTHSRPASKDARPSAYAEKHLIQQYPRYCPFKFTQGGF